MQVKTEAESQTLILWKRTRLILDTLIKFEVNLLSTADSDFLEELSKHPDEPGFYDLYLKCQFYKKLLDTIDNSFYLNLTPPNKILIELLFNPALEDSLVEIYDAEDLAELMANYKTIAGCITADHLAVDKEHDGYNITALVNFDDKELPFSGLKESTEKYIAWYNNNSHRLYDSQSLAIAKVSESEEHYFQKLCTSDKHNVDLCTTKNITLQNGHYLGTTCLSTYVGIVSVAAKEGLFSKLFLTTLGDRIAANIEKFLAACNEQGLQGSFYLLGGFACNLNEYIDVIVADKYPIKDIHLVTPDNRGLGLVCYAKDNTPVIRFSYEKTQIYALDNQDDDSTSLTEEIASKETIKTLPATLKRSNAVFFQPEKNSQDEPDEGSTPKKSKFDIV